MGRGAAATPASPVHATLPKGASGPLLRQYLPAAAVTTRDTVTVARRFRGPPDSGNGGYCCGVVAGRVGGAVEVTLHLPPPLDVPLVFETGETVRLLRGAELVAEGRAADLELGVPQAPSFDEAEEAAKRYPGFEQHVFPTCFVCGPEREPGDGLRIFPGASADGALVAAPWIPDASLASADGSVGEEYVWAALDCPGYFAAADGQYALLGRMAAEVREAPRAGERTVVVGWKIGAEGRKLFAGTALVSETGEVRALARQTWITPKR